MLDVQYAHMIGSKYVHKKQTYHLVKDNVMQELWP
jgi:hypothetical protein